MYLKSLKTLKFGSKFACDQKFVKNVNFIEKTSWAILNLVLKIDNECGRKWYLTIVEIFDWNVE